MHLHPAKIMAGMACALLMNSTLAATEPESPAPSGPPGPATPAEAAPTGAPGALESRVLVVKEPFAHLSRLVIKNAAGFTRVTGWDEETVSATAEIRDSAGRRVGFQVLRTDTGLLVQSELPVAPGAPATTLAVGGATFRIGGPIGAAAIGGSGHTVISNTGAGSVVIDGSGVHRSAAAPAAPGETPTCNLTLFVPRRILASIQNGRGSIEIRNVSGAVDLEAANAPVTVVDFSGSIRGRTSHAPITLENVRGGVNLETSHGIIRAANLDGDGQPIKLATRSAPIDFQLAPGASAHLQADTGTSKASGKLSKPPAGSAASGSLAATPAPLPSEISLQTTHGARIHIW